MSCCFSFDKELLEECSWTEQFATQPELHRYIKRVAERNNLYKHIKFNTRIKFAHWDDESRLWTFVDDNDCEYRIRFFISCLGFLSAAASPEIAGFQDFRGLSYHTSRWSENLELGLDFVGKRIGVIGTGASGIQTITAISKEPSIKSLTVYQRTPDWAVSCNNSDITPEQMEIYKHRSGKWLGVFSATYVNRDTNRIYSGFVAGKIRERIDDQATADSLIPKDHGFGTRRVPLEIGYFEAFNKEYVNLVHLKKTSIEQATSRGTRTADGKEHVLDVLIFAIGFDAFTGAFSAIEWHAKDERRLLSTQPEFEEEATWRNARPRTFLGLTVPKMPNMFMILGPHRPIGNCTRSIEHVAGVIADILNLCHERGIYLR